MILAQQATDRFRASRDRGCAFLLSRLRPDGGIGDPARGVADYYKAVLALQVGGASAAAGRLSDWIRRHGVTADGDFGPRPPEAAGYYHLYYNAWVVLGAARQGHFDLARRGAEFLLRRRDPESGGFYSSVHERDAETLQDLWVVAGAGLAMLYAGELDAARGVGRWLARLMELQPNFPAELYTVWSPAGGLRTGFDPADALRFVVRADAASDQYFFQPGIAAGFLAELFKATGEDRWLDLARQYLRQGEVASDFLLRLLRAGKVGWAASVLYTLTGEARYRDLAARIGDNLIALQDARGAWGGSSPNVIDATAERVVWLDELHQALGHDAP